MKSRGILNLLFLIQYQMQKVNRKKKVVIKKEMK